MVESIRTYLEGFKTKEYVWMTTIRHCGHVLPICQVFEVVSLECNDELEEDKLEWKKDTHMCFHPDVKSEDNE